jgi:hypothetical protein
MTNTNRIPNGTPVQLDDGTTALAYYDGDGTYRTAQRNRVTGGTRVDLGWRREQLTQVLEVRRADR